MQLNNRDALEWVRETAANGESIVGRIIRERREAQAIAARRKAKQRAARIVTYFASLPLAALAGVMIAEQIAAHLP